MNQKIIDLLQEVVRSHRDPDSPEYNECDTAECEWCRRAKAAIEYLKKP